MDTRPAAHLIMSLTDATVLLTGATSGIGRATAVALVPHVRLLLLHGPEPADAATALLDEVRARGRPGTELAYPQADYAHLDDVVRLADQVDNIVDVAARTGDSGAYYDETRPADPNPLARDRQLQQCLHESTMASLDRFVAGRPRPGGS